MNSILAPSSGGLFTLFSKQHITGEKLNIRLDPQGLTNGILAGLVCITASSDSVDSWSAIIIGIIGSLTYSYSVRAAAYFNIDDPLEAFQVHGCCGLMGVISLAFFKKDVGILYSYKSFHNDLGEKQVAGFELLLVQLVGSFIIILWSGTISVIYFTISKKMGFLRMSE
jgi:Amt family ammonium transporter